MSKQNILSGNTPIERLKSLMAILRSDTGCPWDVEQTFETIAPYTIEEAYEVADAIERQNMADLKEELGDLLFQVIFHSQMAEERGLFNFDEVATLLVEKMVRRHPHVFDTPDKRDASQQTQAWEALKAQEREAKAGDEPHSLLSEVPVNLPALLRAQKLQKRASRVGFDWGKPEPVLEKIKEECAELIDARSAGASNDKIQDEMGDILFAAVNLARQLDIDAETALRNTNEKFRRRFEYIERQFDFDQTAMREASLDELEAQWQAAKSTEI